MDTAPPAADAVIAVVSELLTWIGGTVAVLSLIIVCVLVFSASAWHEVEGHIERDSGIVTVRWFGADAVGSARVPEAELKRVSARDTARIWVQHGRSDRVRWVRHGPVFQRALWLLGASVFVVIAATIVSLIPHAG